MFKIFKGANHLINLISRAKVTVKASEKLDFVNSFISVVMALGNKDEGIKDSCYSTSGEWSSCLISQ